jgi:hypothetical protein
MAMRGFISPTIIARGIVRFHDGVAASLQTRRQTGGSIKAGLETRPY